MTVNHEDRCIGLLQPEPHRPRRRLPLGRSGVKLVEDARRVALLVEQNAGRAKICGVEIERVVKGFDRACYTPWTPNQRNHGPCDGRSDENRAPRGIGHEHVVIALLDHPPRS